MRLWYPRLLRTRLMIAFVAVGVLPLLFLGGFFNSFSVNYMTRLYNQRARQQIEPIASELEELLLRYRQLSYVISQDPILIDVLAASTDLDRETALEVYPVLYRALQGNLDGAALHVASLTGTPSLSTHQFPATYRPVNPQEGIYRAANAQPQRTVLFTQSYVNEKGETVNFSLAKVVHDAAGDPIGYVIVDLFKSYLAENIRRANNRFFVDVVVTDNVEFQVVDLFHPENDGDYSDFPFLRTIGAEPTGSEVVQDLVVGWLPIMDGLLTVYGTLPTETSLAGIGRLVGATASIILWAAGIAVLVAILMARHISAPVHQLAAAMQRVEGGDLSIEALPPRRDEIGTLFHGFDRMVREIRELLDKTVQEQEALRKAELKALQAQINPHFLYNTLGTIKSIAKLRGVPEIVTITTELGTLLRGSMNTSATTTTVRESIDVIRSFVRIHDQRHPGRYSLRIDVSDEICELAIPPLILQPIVENAFVHGLEQKVGPGTLSIVGTILGEDVQISVEDDGVGFDPTSLEFLAARDGAGRQDGTGYQDEAGRQNDNGHKDAHIGLANVDRRLKLIFGSAYGITVDSTPGEGCRVTIRVPRRTEGYGL